MNRLSKFVMRLPKAGFRQLTKLPVNTTGDYVSKTINDALASAGLLEPRPASKAHVRASIAKPSANPRVAVASLEELIPGASVACSYTHQIGTIRYKLYVPAGYKADSEVAYPLIVMLHGCKQSPDDFATGTGMNALADQHGFFVAYPAQSPNANGAKCWNWFLSEHQARETGEPALIAGMTKQILSAHTLDPERVYVAGLSAGAAMAVILGTTYPEIYKAVGAHSGLPYAAAHNIPSAFAAMGGKQGVSVAKAEGVIPFSDQTHDQVTPLIVFHGDADRTVDPANGNGLVNQALGAASAMLPESCVTGASVDGVQYTRSIYTTALGDPLVEYWEIHGGGHAWSGGSSTGSFTDTRGPNASAEMVRFFLNGSGNRNNP